MRYVQEGRKIRFFTGFQERKYAAILRVEPIMARRKLSGIGACKCHAEAWKIGEITIQLSLPRLVVYRAFSRIESNVSRSAFILQYP